MNFVVEDEGIAWAAGEEIVIVRFDLRSLVLPIKRVKVPESDGNTTGRRNLGDLVVGVSVG